ncbi:MauE/DoxX family redox-associated membrane protein [Streptomyces sp. NPDC048248]|uniref:MauE/DoxX family redox-associated membrane protein n=1 Tax=Streptomyces sp. NPDC048248 TaxID=3365523 RepID=UPI0037202A62
MPYVLLACRLGVTAVMALAAISKLRALSSFAASLDGFEVVPTWLRRPLTVLVPAAELLIALLLTLPSSLLAGLIGAVLFCCGLTAFTVLVVARGKRVSCACFGATDVPLGNWHILRNTVLLTAAGLGAYLHLHIGGSPTWNLAGIALAVTAASVLTVLIVFTDDIAKIFGSSVLSGTQIGEGVADEVRTTHGVRRLGGHSGDGNSGT